MATVPLHLFKPTLWHTINKYAAIEIRRKKKHEEILKLN